MEELKTMVEYSLKRTQTAHPIINVCFSAGVKDLTLKLMGDMINVQECVYAFFLNSMHQVVGYTQINQGTTNSSTVDIKLLSCFAVKSLACNVIITHNHPSGNAKPSEADDKITTKVKDALNVFGIRLLDHIIVTGDKGKFYSYFNHDSVLLND